MRCICVVSMIIGWAVRVLELSLFPAWWFSGMGGGRLLAALFCDGMSLELELLSLMCARSPSVSGLTLLALLLGLTIA